MVEGLDEVGESLVSGRVRSALFVPGNRPDLMTKAVATSADALILDLEDSVPDAEDAKRAALASIVDWLGSNRSAHGKLICSRINGVDGQRLEIEVDGLVGAGVSVIVLPKVEEPAEVVQVDFALTYAEGKHGVERGSTAIWPIPETARGARQAYEIAMASGRVRFMGAGIAPGGDMARELGVEVTGGGMESLYLRSKVLLDVRAAGIENPMTGVVTDIGDPKVVSAFAAASAQLGYEGLMVIHPTHIDIANSSFGPSRGDLDEAKALLAAIEDAEREGRAAVRFRGRMVDIAMRETALAMLERYGD